MARIDELIGKVHERLSEATGSIRQLDLVKDSFQNP